MKPSIFLFCFFSAFIILNSRKVSAFENNNPTLTQEDSSHYIKHEIVVENKRITFSLPSSYLDSCYVMQNWIVSFWSGYEYKKILCSSEYNSFSFLIRTDSIGIKDEKTRDFYMKKEIFKRFTLYNSILPIVPFVEKKQDVFGHSYYLISGASVDVLKKEKKFDVEEQHSIYSYFAYFTFFGMETYEFVLESRDNVNDFSYEEKRKIIESVRIEEIR